MTVRIGEVERSIEVRAREDSPRDFSDEDERASVRAPSRRPRIIRRFSAQAILKLKG